MVSLFCRHNRFISDCTICSKGTVLDPARSSNRGGSRAGTPRAPRTPKPSSREFSGPHASAGPYEDADGMRYEVRLERVPGGVRLAEWSGSRLRKRAPVFDLADLPGLLTGATGVLAARDAEALAGALAREVGDSSGAPGISRGRSGDFKEELRVEPLDHEKLRIARWVLRPGAGWQLQDAPPMLPAARFAEAVADAVAKGLGAAGVASGEA